MVTRDEFFGDCDGVRPAKPSLEIKSSSVEIGRIEGSKWRVRENIDPEDLKIFAREIRQRHQTSHERRRGGDAGSSRNHWENRLGKFPGRRRDLQFRLASYHIDRRGKRTIRTVIGDLGREINRDAKRDAQNIQGREQRMPPQVTQNVPAKNARILRCHRDWFSSQRPATLCPAASASGDDAMEIITNLLVGVLDRSATLLIGTNAFASGK
jgi:hypothetical protein